MKSAPDERIRAAAIEAEGADWVLLDEEGRTDAIDHAATVIRVYLDPSPETVERVAKAIYTRRHGPSMSGPHPTSKDFEMAYDVLAVLVAPQDTGGKS